LRLPSTRKKIISLFINSPEFGEWMNKENGSIKFPLYDPVGWIYTTKMKNKENFDEKYLMDLKQFGFWKILFYKDAKSYYSLMIIISILFGIFYSYK